MYWPFMSTSGPGAVGPARADLMLPRQCETCWSLEKQRHHIFHMKKAQREVLKES